MHTLEAHIHDIHAHMTLVVTLPGGSCSVAHIHAHSRTPDALSIHYQMPLEGILRQQRLQRMKRE